MQPSNGTDRATRTGSRSQRRVWRCNGCRKQFSVLTDTIFHGTKISIRTWLLVMFEVASSTNSVSAWEISRKYEITNESAWHLLHRIRRAMERDPLAAMFRGTIQADEAWIGGNPKNRHANDLREPIRRTGAGRTDKQPILSLVHYETREVRSVVVNDVNGETLLAAIDSMAELENTWLQTDGAKAYNPTSPRVRHHLTVNHEAGEYVKDGGGTNIAEGYLSQLRRSLDGTHHHVSTEHLHRYLAQFDFMYSHCRETDSQRLRRLLGNVEGRRLSYKPLIGQA